MRHLRLPASAVSLSSLILLACGGGGGGDGAPAQPVVESSAYLTDQGKLFFVPIVDGVASAPQLVSSNILTGPTENATAVKLISGHFDTATGNFERAKYSGTVFLDGSTSIKRLDLSGSTLAVSDVGAGSELCRIEGIGPDLQNQDASIISVVTAGPDHDCATDGDSARFLQHLGGGAGVTVPGNIGYSQPGPRTATGMVTSVLGVDITDDTLTLQRIDATTLAQTPLLTRTDGVAGAMRFKGTVAVGAGRVVFALNLPQISADEYYLYDDADRSIRLLYRVDNPVHRESASLSIPRHAFFTNGKFFIGDKSRVVSFDPAADPVAPQTVVDFGAGRDIERILDLETEMLAIVRNADDTLTVSRFSASGGSATDVGSLPASYSIIGLPGDVALINAQVPGEEPTAFLYAASTHTMSSVPGARWIGGTLVTTPNSATQGFPSRIIGKIGETGLKVEGFDVAYLLATRETDHSDLILYRRSALDAPITLMTTQLVNNGRMDSVGQHLLVELALRRGPGVIDRDIYMLDVGPTPRLVPIATQPGVDEFLMAAEVR